MVKPRGRMKQPRRQKRSSASAHSFDASSKKLVRPTAIKKSVRETPSTISGYTTTLREYSILNRYDRDGAELFPFDHQREAVEFCSELEWAVIAHAAGLGKSATICQLFALLWLAVKNKDAGKEASLIITAPSSVLEQWCSTIQDWLRVNKHRMIVTRCLADLSDMKKVEDATVIIVSRDTLSNAYATCHEKVTENGKTFYRRMRDESGDEVPLHPVYARTYTMGAFDEGHFLRNDSTRWSCSHNELSKLCDRRYTATASPIYNRARDMQGLCWALGAGGDWEDVRYWTDPKGREINVEAVRRFRQYRHRRQETILDLPELLEREVYFNPELTPSERDEYNALYEKAKEATERVTRKRTQKRNKDGEDSKGVMNQFTRMQQAMVSPVLARHGQTAFASNSELMEEAILNPRGALKCAEREIEKLIEDGYNKIVVSSYHTEPLRILYEYLKHRGVDLGETLQFDGDVAPAGRRRATRAFVKPGTRTTMFLSIGAGGVGVHLVGKPSEKTAMIFFGPLPPSPMEVYQAQKRVHRIGQEWPVQVLHLKAPHSMDYAIAKSHEEKANLSAFVMDDDEEALGESGQLALKAIEHAFINSNDADVRATGTTWKHMTGYMKVCKPLQQDGNFPALEDTRTREERMRAAGKANSMDAPSVSVFQGAPLPKRRKTPTAEPVEAAPVSPSLEM